MSLKLMKKIIVCGGRDYDNVEHVHTVLRAINTKFFNGLWICTGGASGADTLAEDWAKRWNVPFSHFPADWDQYSRSAGPIRNQQMLDWFEPHGVVAFGGGTGTKDMIDRSVRAGLNVLVIDREDYTHGDHNGLISSPRKKAA